MKVLCLLLMALPLVLGQSSGSSGGQPNTRIFGGGGLGSAISSVAGIAAGILGGGQGGYNQGGLGGLGGLGGRGSGCRYWCRTPEGQAYCCENNRQPTNPYAVGIVKPGRCPPVRPVCPRITGGAPVTCSNDGACNGVDKCCFDRCLQEHVCKAPLGFGR